jgi:uncharacterized damage-inducible protein DinB
MDNHTHHAKALIERTQGRLLRTFAAVPDDKLTWSPSSTSKSALDIVKHVAQTNLFIAKALCGEPLPDAASLPEIEKAMEAAASHITTRDQAVACFNESVATVLATIDKLTEDDLAKDIVLPFTTMPASALIYISGMHAANHAGQIDYIQTIYGDMDEHM